MFSDTVEFQEALSLYDNNIKELILYQNEPFATLFSKHFLKQRLQTTLPNVTEFDFIKMSNFSKSERIKK